MDPKRYPFHDRRRAGPFHRGMSFAFPVSSSVNEEGAVGMPLFRFGQNWDPFGDLEREVDRLLRSVNLTFQGFRVGRQYPAVNLYELEGEYVLTAELPGTRIE